MPAVSFPMNSGLKNKDDLLCSLVYMTTIQRELNRMKDDRVLAGPDNTDTKQMAMAFEIEATNRWQKVGSMLQSEQVEWKVTSAEGKPLDKSCYEVKYENIGNKSKEIFFKNTCDTTIVVTSKVVQDENNH